MAPATRHRDGAPLWASGDFRGVCENFGIAPGGEGGVGAIFDRLQLAIAFPQPECLGYLPKRARDRGRRPVGMRDSLAEIAADAEAGRLSAVVAVIFAERIRRGLPLLHYADEIGITAATLSHWRSGGVPKLDGIERVARALGYRLALVPIGEPPHG